MTRNIISNLNLKKKIDLKLSEGIEEPKWSTQDIYGIVGTDLKKSFDVKEVIARIVDSSQFDEFKAQYGSTLVTRIRSSLWPSNRNRCE